MTEEIIIDCAFYKDGVCASPINKTCEYCKNIDVSKCYHKQLKRLEQENKELKAYKDVNEDFKKAWDELNRKYTEVLKLAKENADSNEYCLQELEQENKKLKEQASLYENLYNHHGEIVDEYKKQRNKIILYRSALEEINATVKTMINGVTPADNVTAYLVALNAIETRINEVLGNEQNN